MKLNVPSNSAAGITGRYRTAVESDRHSVRSADRGLWRKNHQYAPALGSGSAGVLQLSGIQPRRFRGRCAETLEAESLTRVLYPDDSTSMGQGVRFVQEYFLVACSLADLVRRFRRVTETGERYRGRSLSS